MAYQAQVPGPRGKAEGDCAAAAGGGCERGEQGAPGDRDKTELGGAEYQPARGPGWVVPQRIEVKGRGQR